jgi:hypothetical protein
MSGHDKTLLADLAAHRPGCQCCWHLALARMTPDGRSKVMRGHKVATAQLRMVASRLETWGVRR